MKLFRLLFGLKKKEKKIKWNNKEVVDDKLIDDNMANEEFHIPTGSTFDEEIINILNESDHSCNKDFSSYKNCTDLCTQILKKSDHVFGSLNNKGETSLMIACKKRKKAVCRTMLKSHPISLLNKINMSGNTALMLACSNSYYDSGIKYHYPSYISMEKVCMDMLKNPFKCALDQINSDGDTRFNISMRK